MSQLCEGMCLKGHSVVDDGHSLLHVSDMVFFCFVFLFVCLFVFWGGGCLFDFFWQNVYDIRQRNPDHTYYFPIFA